MADLNHKKSDIQEMKNKYPDGFSSEEGQSMEIKRCFDCGTSKTPLWRGGPAGPKSLCNACGIRSRKRRRAMLGLKPEEKKSKNNSNSSTSSKLGSPLHQRLIEIGREVLMQRSTVDRQRRQLGEEEQAAILLMALSCGSVYA